MCTKATQKNIEGMSGKRVTTRGSGWCNTRLGNHETASSVTRAATAQRNIGLVKREQEVRTVFINPNVKQPCHFVKHILLAATLRYCFCNDLHITLCDNLHMATKLALDDQLIEEARRAG